ncbi:MAG: hypothetical protein HFH41_03940 [Lachnospiraceae bacterium]|nr:hypothetical protein [Lachnospiraceae bacterium]
MLVDEMKKLREEHEPMTARPGECRFCGQTAVENAPEGWTQGQVDEFITEVCRCNEGALYRIRKKQKERAHERIEFLFGEKSEFGVTPEKAEQLLHESVELVADREVQEVTVNIGDGVKAKINITQKDTIKITRQKAEKSAYEA